MLRFAIPLFVVAFINIVFAIIIFSRRRGRVYNLLYSLATLSLAGWAFGLGMYYLDGQLSNIRFWVNFLYISGTLIPTFLLPFAITFHGRKNLKWWQYILLFIPAIVIGVMLFKTNLIISVVDILPERHIEYGLWLMLFVVHFIIYMSVTFYALIKKYVRLTGISKTQVQYAIYGTLITSILGSTTNVILPVFDNFSYFHIGPYFTLIMVASFLYAITRYRLMDIQSIVFRSLTFSFIILFASGLLTFITAFLMHLAGIESLLFTSIILAILVAIGYRPLRNFVERATNKVLYKKSYDPDILLADITKSTASLLDLNELLPEVSKAIVDAFHCDKIGFGLINKDGTIEAAYYEGFKKEAIDALVYYKGLSQIMSAQFRQYPGIQIIDQLKTQYENKEYEPIDVKFLYMLFESDIALIIPLTEKEGLTGVIVIGNKKSGDSYAIQDINVLNIIAGQTTIAIKNALLFGEQKQFAATLKHKVEEATEDLQVANKHLKQLDQSKSEFLSIAAHQLRTPLTGIKGYVSMFLEGDFGDLTEEQKQQLERIFRSSDRLTRLVDVFLNVSRIETGRLDIKKSKVQLEEVLDEVVNDLTNPAKKKNIEITVQKPENPLPIMLLDKDKIHYVFMNLVDNAIKYTPKGWINVRMSRSKSLVTIEIRDSGMGIDPNEIDKLFQKFSRAEAISRIHTGGSGLGLFIARKIVEGHGGRIWAESEGDGKGSSFTFTLPIIE